MQKIKRPQLSNFLDLEKNGHLNHGYVHKEFQRQGIGQLLLNVREQKAKALGLKKVVADVSITAKAFFERNHFVIIRKQLKTRGGVTFIQYRMEKNYHSNQIQPRLNRVQLTCIDEFWH